MTAITRAGSRLAPTLVGAALTALLLAQHATPDRAGKIVLIVALAGAFSCWALMDLDSFMLVAVLAAFIYPKPLVTAGGALVSLGDVLLVLGIAMWVARSARGVERPLWLRRNPMLTGLLAFAFVTALSILWSVNAQQTAKQIVQIGEIVVVIPLLYASVPSSLAGIRRGMIAYVWATSVLSAVLFTVFARHAAAGKFLPVYLPGLNKNASGAFVGIGFVLAVALWSGQREAGRVRFIRLLVLVEVAGLIGSASRGAGLGSLFAAVITTLVLRRGGVRAILFAFALGAGFLAWIQPRIQLATGAAHDNPHGADAIRRLAWHAAGQTIRNHPLTGVGGGAWSVTFPSNIGGGLADPNNLFLLTWAELGVAGMLALFYLLYRYGLLFRACARLRGEARVYGVAACAATLAQLVHDQVDISWGRGAASIAFGFVGVGLSTLRLGGETAGGPDAEQGRLELPRRARVLQVVTSRGFAGIERHVLGLASGLRARGVDCTIACPPDALQLRAAAIAAGVPVQPAKTAGRAWLPDLVRSVILGRPDIVHVHDGIGALTLAQVANLRGSRLVRTQHFAAPASAARQGIGGRLSRSAQRKANIRLAAFIAVSEGVAQASDRRAEIDADRVVVVPPGIDVPPESDLVEAQRLRDELTMPVVCFLGRLEQDKHVELLVEAAPRVRRRLPDCRFVVAGSGSSAAKLRDRARALGVADAFEWCGWVDDPAAVLRRAHVFASPCPVEAFGFAPLEAMAWGLPVVSVSSSGAQAMVVDGQTGLVADGIDGFAQALIRLAGDKALAARMGAAAHEVAKERFSTDRMLDAIETVYATAL